MFEALDKIGPVVCRYIMAAWLGWTLIDGIMRHGEPKEWRIDAGAIFFVTFIKVMLLAGGGFWG